MKIARPELIVPLFVLVGVAQYAGVAIDALHNGNAAVWQMESEALQESGWSRYLKDAFLATFAIWWIWWAARRPLPLRATRMFHMYWIWLTLLILLGVLGFLVAGTPPLFLLSGLRWLLLLHCSVGMFFLMKAWPTHAASEMSILRVLFVVAAADLLVVFYQVGLGQAVHNLGLGQGRAPGLFSNAGVAGFFAFGVTLLALQTRVRSSLRVLIFGAAFLIALASGTRSMVIAIFIVSVAYLLECAERLHNKLVSKAIKILVVGAAVVLASLAYDELIRLVDRGGILEVQLQSGGRISNFLEVISTLGDATPTELALGQGLGVGTNTVHVALNSAGVDPLSYRFNLLVDNAFLTQFFQFGALGSLVFWGGILCFIASVHPHRRAPALARRYRMLVLLSFLLLWVGNPFEQFFLMLPIAVSFGVPFWMSREEGLAI